ncbi:hypothetical protein FOB82_03065 [Corynebacterium xerosis]|uniref:Uncharacterized protein n=1 Tax=Corynebacterium xerosis TaxID=1725 RepID=A0A6B8TB37_9CORY|nr:hypothetical protein [Corynebacterium xerosis]QGS34077.1 hypothetical protein FOB82_03065 [Corynebacterium xerosis]
MTAPTPSPRGILFVAGLGADDADRLLMQLPIIGYRDVPAIARVIARAHAAGRASGMDLIHLRMATDIRGSAVAGPLEALHPGAPVAELRAALDEVERLRLAEWGVAPR